MARLRSNNVFGTITNNPLAAAGTTLNAAGLADLVAVVAPDVAVITLDPNRVNGAPEIVHVTAHTGAAQSATILRGQEGTAARSHPLNTFWIHGWTALDAGLGTLGYAQVVASQGSITTEVDATGLSVAVTVGSGRRVRISAFCNMASTVAADEMTIRIKEGATLLNLASVSIAAAGRWESCQPVTVETPSAGAHTYKLTAARNSGTGTVTLNAGTDFPAFILVEDIGVA